MNHRSLRLGILLSSLSLLGAQDRTIPLWQTGEPLEIGVSFGEPEYEFGSIGGVVELTDGDIVVAETQSDEIRFFDRAGAFVRGQGREGEGPGEYLFVTALDECGRDSVFAVDNRQKRITVLDHNGQLGRTMDLPSLGTGGLYRFSCDPIGLVLVASWPDESAALQKPDNRAHTTKSRVAVTNTDGSVSKEIGEFPGGERVFQIIDGQVRGSLPREFGTETFVAVGGGRGYIGYSGSKEIVVVDGEDVHTGTLPLHQRSIADQDLRAFRENATAKAAQGLEAEVRRQWRDYDFPESYPYYSDLQADPSGNLWVRSYPAFGEEDVEWLVLDMDLRPIARVITPVAFAVKDVGNDYLLGVWTGENRVETIRRYPILRDNPGTGISSEMEAAVR